MTALKMLERLLMVLVLAVIVFRLTVVVFTCFKEEWSYRPQLNNRSY